MNKVNKYLLLLSGVLLLFGSCKRDVLQPDYDSEGQVISLTSGAVLGRAANIGVREQFETGDQIGVISVFATTTTGGATALPRWDTTAHFENKVAAHVSNNTSDPVVTTFGWGPAAEGKEHNRSYPSKKRQIFLYSYYPYVASGAGSKYIPIDPEAATDAERQPKLSVDLIHGAIGCAVPTDDVLKKQPDILYYIGASAVSSIAPTPSLNYNHALAQIRFTIKRPEGSSPCSFVKLTFKTASKGILNLATGKFALAAADPSPNFENRRDAVYTIEILDPTKRSIPSEGADPLNPDYLDILNPDKELKFNYLMVLPLDKADAEMGEIKLVCNFGTGGVDDIRNFNIPLADGLKKWEPGKLNTLAINVSLYSVSISASITPWGVGETMELPAE